MLYICARASNQEWKTRPTIALIRRVTLQTPSPELDDWTVLKVAAQSGTGVNSDFISYVDMPPKSTKIQGCVRDRCWEFSAEESELGRWNLLTRSGPLPDQFLLITGKDDTSTAEKNQAVCLGAIRAIRAHRPSVYAQFLGWTREAADVV